MNQNSLTFRRLKHHIRKNTEFKTLYANGRRAENTWIRIWFAKAAEPNQGKMAFIASKRVGNAVVRNACRRRIKEIVRLNQDQISREFDIIFYTKQKINQIPFSEATSAILNLLQNKKLLATK